MWAHQRKIEDLLNHLYPIDHRLAKDDAQYPEHLTIIKTAYILFIPNLPANCSIQIFATPSQKKPWIYTNAWDVYPSSSFAYTYKGSQPPP